MWCGKEPGVEEWVLRLKCGEERDETMAEGITGYNRLRGVSMDEANDWAAWKRLLKWKRLGKLKPM